ncbi:sodium/glutamate symporter [Sporosarcina highlanderae]|uniref:Sodium/glutamate symporter n=1 Tax=Sporosarcina highlanderae TaxID=3035916 RepID=A0ABT8JSH7_9BACL|nr:sodium/glutamate symporter [Sporosarcina highlanderae]MDN4608106.1 sodium/glutamate symporter [Sporosarcina highlanderae]
MFSFQLGVVETLCLALALLLLGSYLAKNINFLGKFCIPAPVIGGFLFAIVAAILRGFGLIEISLDTTLQSLFMLAFFTTVGLGASFTLIRKGGKLLVIYWLICGALAFIQNVIGVSLAKVFGLQPLIGIMVGAVSMEGGHGGAAAFGETLESLGIDSAVTVGLAAATLGLIAGGLVGGPISKYLITKNNLKPNENAVNLVDLESAVKTDEKKLTANLFINQVFIITLCMSLGTLLGKYFSEITGFVLPGYVGAMFVAIIVRNAMDKLKMKYFDLKGTTIIGDLSLGIFLSMALMSIQLWQLADMALPMVLIIAVQVIFMVLFTIFVVFRLLGKNFDAAVMAGGLAGHGLGATPNAIANMDAITRKYGPSPTAFLIIPIVGAFLVDALYIPIILAFINFFS